MNNRREDFNIINAISKFDSSINGWSKIPLMLFDNDSDFISNIEKENKGKVYLDIIDTINLGIATSPVDNFIFTNHKINFTDSLTNIKIIDKKKFNLKFHFFNQDSKIKNSFYVDSIIELFEDKMGITFNNLDYIKESILGKEVDVEKVMKEMERLIVDSLMYVFFILGKIEETDLRPIEISTPIYKQTFKRGKAKNTKVGTSRSIVYLNKLPVKYTSAPQGGHHASPKYHYRRGHKRVMVSERFKNHPDYMKEKWIKPTWVGEREAIIDGVTYKVL